MARKIERDKQAEKLHFETFAVVAKVLWIRRTQDGGKLQKDNCKTKCQT